MNELSINNPMLTESNLMKTHSDHLQRFQGEIVRKKDLSEQERAEYSKAARGFESMFIYMMLKEMKKGLNETTLGDENMTFGSETLGSQMDIMFADQISQTGKGIGIAETIFNQLTGQEMDRNITITKHVDLENMPRPIKEQENLIDISKFADRAINSKMPFSEKINKRLSQFEGIINGAASKFDLPVSLIKSVITAESAGKHNAVSSAGAKGLMQLMDGTASDLGVNDPFNPVENITGGSKYLRQMLDLFSGDLDKALAAYNAGPGNVQKYNGIPPFKETQNYVAKIKRYLEKF
jgi:Rod binding domain-containing protein